MAATLAQMKEGLDSARGAASASGLGDTIVTEVKILGSRRECLNLVMNGSVEDFTAYITRVKAEKPQCLGDQDCSHFWKRERGDSGVT